MWKIKRGIKRQVVPKSYCWPIAVAISHTRTRVKLISARFTSQWANSVLPYASMFQRVSTRNYISTAVSRKVVQQNVYATMPKGIVGNGGSLSLTEAFGVSATEGNSTN